MAWILQVALLFAVCASIYACSLAVRTRSETRDRCNELHELIDTIQRAERMTPAKLAELAEFQDAMSRAEALLKAVNQREVMRARRAAPAEVHDLGNDKDALRRRAGLIAGRPVKHG